MPEYRYHARNQEEREVTGVISAANVTEAVTALESQGWSVQSISAETFTTGADAPVGDSDQPLKSDSQQSLLERHFEALIQRRDTLLPALRAMVRELPGGRAKHELEQLIAELSTTDSARELCRSKLAIRWLPLLASGFSTETTSQRFSDLIAYATRDLRTRSERRRYLLYPSVVLLTALLVLGVLSLLVVPAFESMFDEFGIRLPAPTRMVIGLTREFRLHPIRAPLMFVVIAGLIYGLIRLWTHFAITTRLFGSAISGNSPAVSAMSSFTGQLAELLQIGVPLSEAIRLAGRGCEHHYFQKAAEQLSRDASAGVHPLGRSTVARVFPANVIHALDAKDGRPNVTLLRELSSMYSQRVLRRVDWTVGAMAQVSVVLLGGAVGFLALALLLPLVTLITALS